MDTTRICRECNIEKDICKFARSKNDKGYMAYRRICTACRSKKYRESHPDYVERQKIYARNLMQEKFANESPENKKERLKKSREKYKNDAVYREKVKQQAKQWKIKNPDKVRLQKKGTPQNKLRHNISNTIRDKLKSINASKNGRSTFKDILPYSVQELYAHLESKFEPGMTWENHGFGEGKWHIDHVTPDSWFTYDSVDHPDFQKSWALENLQPMWSHENISKGNRFSGK